MLDVVTGGCGIGDLERYDMQGRSVRLAVSGCNYPGSTSSAKLGRKTTQGGMAGGVMWRCKNFQCGCSLHPSKR